MTFFIGFVDDNRLVESPERIDEFQVGRIVIGEFEEWFESPLAYWSIEDYRAHWRRSIERTIAGAAKSVLFTSMYEPQCTNWLLCWPLYRERGIVYVQNQMLFMEGIASEFDPTNPYRHIQDRETIDEEGRRISEWKTTVEDLRGFFRTLSSG